MAWQQLFLGILEEFATAQRAWRPQSIEVTFRVEMIDRRREIERESKRRRRLVPSFHEREQARDRIRKAAVRCAERQLPLEFAPEPTSGVYKCAPLAEPANDTSEAA